MKIRHQQLLEPGSTIALLAPASPLANADELPAVVAAAESFGLRVRQMPSLKKRRDYTAGTGEQRASDLQRAFADPKIHGIACLRGGYGTAHVMPHLDWKLLAAAPPKPFVGYSDLTMLLNPLATHAGRIAWHGPTMNFFLRSDEPTQVSRQALTRALFEPFRPYSLRELCGPHFTPQCIVKGQAKGRLIGGNLSVFHTLLGTPWEPKGRDFILFLEEIGEKAYRLDRMLTHLIQSGFMKRVRGIALGHFTDCGPASGDQAGALAVLRDVLSPLRVPILAGLPVGHERPSFPLPIGARVELDATRGDLHITGA